MQNSVRSGADVTAQCPVCGAEDGLPFYELQEVPSHSVLLMHSREEATGFPVGDLSLTFCRQCSFIWNQRFDAGLNQYSDNYEETQHFSARFVKFVDELISRLIADYDIRNKTVLEIGCGKAEFLLELCERGSNIGIGIDPAVRPERLPETHRKTLTLIPELYSLRHGQLHADVILCRHTLEHIQPVREFLMQIRRSLREHTDPLLILEVPAMEIVLREQRFWDVYYEHCSYFTEPALQTALTLAGFDTLDITREFDDQYLVAVARPTEIPKHAATANTTATDAVRVAQIAALVNEFSSRVNERFRYWRNYLSESSQRNRRIAVWGGGSKCVSFLTSAGFNQEIADVVDINPHKHGRFLPGTGHEVVPPDTLLQRPPDEVLLMNSIYRSEVDQILQAMGISPRLIGL